MEVADNGGPDNRGSTVLMSQWATLFSPCIKDVEIKRLQKHAGTMINQSKRRAEPLTIEEEELVWRTGLIIVVQVPRRLLTR